MVRKHNWGCIFGFCNNSMWFKQCGRPKIMLFIWNFISSSFWSRHSDRNTCTRCLKARAQILTRYCNILATYLQRLVLLTHFKTIQAFSQSYQEAKFWLKNFRGIILATFTSSNISSHGFIYYLAILFLRLDRFV